MHEQHLRGRGIHEGGQLVQHTCADHDVVRRLAGDRYPCGHDDTRATTSSATSSGDLPSVLTVKVATCS